MNKRSALKQKELDKVEALVLKGSFEHTKTPAIIALVDGTQPSYRSTWEAGRACGFHAGYAQALEDVANGLLEKIKNENPENNTPTAP